MRAIAGFFLLLLGALFPGVFPGGFPGATSAQAQDIRWTAHTSLRQITDVSASDEAIWAGTTGGVFSYHTGSGEMTAYTASNGLHSVQTQAITYDPERNVVWIGYRDGVLDRLDPETGEIASFRDIERADRFTSREINRIVVRGDSVFVATSFGVVVFDPEKEEVRDSYSKLGSISAGTAVFDLTFAPGPSGESLWAATADGVAYAAMSTPNLQDPTAWTIERSGLPGTDVRSIAYFGDRIYVGTTVDLAVRDNTGRFTASGLTSLGVFAMAHSPGGLIAVGRFDPILVSPDGTMQRAPVPGYQDPVAAVMGPDGALWLGDTQGGLVAIEPLTGPNVRILHEEVYPEGPYHNLFMDLAVGEDGSLWAAGGFETGAGFYRFRAGIWDNFISRFMPEVGSSYERIHVDGRGHAWAGSAGNALAEVTSDGELRIWNHENSSLRPTPGTTSFVLVGGIASDKDGKVWVTTRASPVPLHVYDPANGTWTGIPRISCNDFTNTGVTFDRIFIDAFDQKWIVVLNEANLRQILGLLVLDTNRTPENIEDDHCNFFAKEGSGGQGLPGTAVRSVTEDRDGLVWIGTERGLSFMINSGIVAQDRSAAPIWPQFADRSQGTFLLNGLKINDLAVDPANRLWVATDEGVKVVQQVEGGYALVEQFTNANSPLLSNIVTSLGIDAVSGRVYMATDQGLISYESDAVAASKQPRNLKVYPNPVRIEGSEPSIFIEGLVEETDLRVVTLTGEVVARVETRGGRARWNGRDTRGEFVPSGVYLVVAVGTDGQGAAYGKVAVVR